MQDKYENGTTPFEAEIRIVPGDSALTVSETAFATPPDFLQRLDGEINASGGEVPPNPEMEGSIGRTMFDLPNSEDGSVTVLLPQDSIKLAPSQAMMRIESRDTRRYLAIVTAGPFAEPDSIRGDSPMITTIVTRGGDIYLPPYHGRIQVSILGEEQKDGTLSPPRFRPLPNSPIFALNDEESAAALRAEGDMLLGRVIGHANLGVRVPSDLKSVLPRHAAVLGTTGGGKSTTIARLVQQAQAAGMAVILLDVEGEYTFLHEPTEDPHMLTALQDRGLAAVGVPVEKMTLYHLVDRDTTNPQHPRKRPFSLQFARLSPYAVIEILALNDAQAERFLKAYDVAKAVMRDLGVFPEQGNAEQERFVLEMDEFERGYPRLTLSLMLDFVGACRAVADKAEPVPFNTVLQSEKAKAALLTRIKTLNVPGHAISWQALLGRLSRLNRLKVFDVDATVAKPLTYKELLKTGSISVIDLSDAGMSELSNIVIADLLRGVQEAQDAAYQQYEKGVFHLS